MTVAKRWEDVTPIWTGPFYGDRALRYDASVDCGFLSGRLITCVDVVDWDGDGGRDMILSAWDACYDGVVLLRREIGRNADGTPVLGREEVVENVRGYVTAVADGDIFHLLSASRLRPHLLFYRNRGRPGAPAFGEPEIITLAAQWVKGNETLHVARMADIDGDGKAELLVGTDYWNDYWPHGIEWNEPGYRGFDQAARWLGGPLRGFLYVFRNLGTVAAPSFGTGRPMRAGANNLEVYGQLAPTFGDFRGTGALDIVAGEFLDVLSFFPCDPAGGHAEGKLLRKDDGGPVRLDHCIHFPCAVDWNGDGLLDLVVGAEDGYITFLANTGTMTDGMPVFRPPVRIETTVPTFHAGVLAVPAAHDWNGNGAFDLIAGGAQGELLFYENAGTNAAPVFRREVKLTAGGKEIRIAAGAPGSVQGPSEVKFGYSCPVIGDWDGDGRPDIIMSDVTGYHTFFRNRGGHFPPEFEEGIRLTHAGRPFKTVWRVRPAIVDWMGEGLSYLTLDEEGVLASYDRLSATELGAKRLICWQDGAPITFTEDIGGGLGRMKLCPCDWTGSGTIDILVGTHGRASIPPGPAGLPRHSTGTAAVILLENIGSNARPQYAPPRHLRLGGEPLEFGMHECAPEIVRPAPGAPPDLLVGIEDGSIVRFRHDELTW